MWIPDFVKQIVVNNMVERLKEKKDMIEFLQGKKTYIVMVVGIVVNGLFAMGYIDDKTVTLLDGVIVSLGLGTIRAGIAKILK